jgi:hypothetical protein
MEDEVLDVLKQESGRTVESQDAGDVEEQRALRLAQEPKRLPESVPRGCASGGKRLAWESRQQHIMRRDLAFRQAPDISINGVVNDEVCGVSLLAPRVPLARSDTPPANRLKGYPHASDSCEQIEKSEARHTPNFVYKRSREGG